MSEVSNNRQQRIDRMKDLIRRLHNGAAERTVREQLESLLDQTDYKDVFAMEVQLIQEGLDAESIRELCDTHTRVLARSLDQSGTPQTTPGHPVHTFLEENRELARVTSEVRRLITEVAAMPPEADAMPAMRGIQAQLNG